MKTIVAAIDFSDLTPAVIDTAVDLAEALDAELVLFHAAPPTEPWVMAGVDGRVAVGMVQPINWERQQEEDRLARLEALRARLAEEGVNARTHMTNAVQRKAICRALDELNPAFIVIGSHRHGALYDLLGPGICSRIVRRASCPVVVVHPQDRPLSTRPPAPRPDVIARA
jgi:nucleotide-binding universal stress UspA family protein